MSEKLPTILEPSEQDISLLLAAKCHLGSKNVSNDMKKYMFTRRSDGVFIIHIGKLWEKLLLAARVIVCVNPNDIYVTSSSLHGRRPASKISAYLGVSANCGRFPPGTFTKSIVEPTLLICMDPRDDFQAINESSKCSIPVIAFANSHSSLRFVDIAIPCNNNGSQSIGVLCWLLTRAVLRLRGALNYDDPWKVIPDMFFYNEEESVEDQDNGEVTSYTNDYIRSGKWQGNNAGNFETGNWSGEQAFASDAGGWSGDKTVSSNTGGWSGEQAVASDTGVENAPSLWSGNDNTFGSTDRTFDLNQFTISTTNIDWADEDPAGEESTETNLESMEQIEIILPEEEQQSMPIDPLGWESADLSSNTNQRWDNTKPAWD